MANLLKDWPIILDKDTYSHLVELSENLSKVEESVKKLVSGKYQQWTDKNYEMDQNLTNAENKSSNNWCDITINWNEDNNNQFDWFTTGSGEVSNDKSNNQKSNFTTHWNDPWNTEQNWANDDSKNETSFNWDSAKISEWDKSYWESGWEKYDPKESNLAQFDWRY